MSRKRILIIHNPTSGRRRADFMASVAVALTGLGARVDIRVTEGFGHATQLAASLEPDTQDCIVAAGGDGTVNEVLNGLAKLEDAPPLGVIPLGTANVLALETAYPKKPADIARVLFAAPARPLFPGILRQNGSDKRLFALMVGVGLDARIVAGVSPSLKRLMGKGAYGIETAYQWLKGGLPDYDIAIDGKDYTAGSIIITNGRLYAGKFVVAPDADIGVSGFKVLLLKGNRTSILANAAAMAAGALSRKKGVRVIEAKEITISGPAGEPVQADGDLLGRLPVTIAAAAKPVMIIAPDQIKLH
ncbi:MAG: diacylglycerol kinase family lipid kinase [Rhodospirillales bacterium]|nr:diacylglycerol kinase family lipid kinase [Rhodospirillales bacterium]